MSTSNEAVAVNKAVEAVKPSAVLPRYFDLHVTGIGYLNRFREVTPRRGEPFCAVTVAAIHGESGACQHTYFDCKIVGDEAIERCKALAADINAKKAVLVGFKVGDIYAETYEAKTDQGLECRAAIKGRLLKITWAKVDGETRFAASPPTTAGGAGDVSAEPRSELAQLGAA